MSQQLINRSPDLKQLRDEGFDLEIRSGYLLLNDVPYVNSHREVHRATLISKLCLADDVTTRPDDHVAHWTGSYPCHQDGRSIDGIRNNDTNRTLADGVVVQHSFSAKPKPSDSYPDYYSKMTTYAAILSGPAQAVDPTATAKTFAPVLADSGSTSVFRYIDTASSRAEIVMVTAKLALSKIAIVGLGGTGSYVLDLVAKTPVQEIHVWDGDLFLQHNAFRAPGAASSDDLKAKRHKVTHFSEMYSRMRLGIVEHAEYVDEDNVEQLRGMEFVFLCMDGAVAKNLIVERLEAWGIPFVDVGLGVDLTDNTLGGILRVTTSTPTRREHFRGRVSFHDGAEDNEYDRNIQIADLNAMNAVLAVIKWKKMFGFYRDLDFEHHCTYTIDGNVLNNEDRL